MGFTVIVTDSVRVVVPLIVLLATLLMTLGTPSPLTASTPKKCVPGASPVNCCDVAFGLFAGVISGVHAPVGKPAHAARYTWNFARHGPVLVELAHFASALPSVFVVGAVHRTVAVVSPGHVQASVSE